MTLEAWSISLGRVAGTGHRLSGAPCQDDAIVRTAQDGRSLIAALSDGAGSGRLTHLAAAVAVRSSTYFLHSALETSTPLTRDLLTEAFTTATDDVARLGRHLMECGASNDPRDVACTLIILVLDGDRLLLGQVGDGAAVVRTCGRLECLTPAPVREYVNEATFLVTRGALDDLFILDRDASDVTAVALMTDGLQHLGIAYPENTPFEGLFDPLFAYASAHAQAASESRAADLNAFLDSETVNTETDDDKTLLLAVRTTAPAAAPRPQGT